MDSTPDTEHLCLWCQNPQKPLPPGSRYCERKCRQAAWRLGKRVRFFSTNAKPGTFGYADPGYIGLAAKYYAAEPDFRGEVDHPALIRDMLSRGFTGWALSLSVKLRSLQIIINALPQELIDNDGARLCAWRKPHPVPKKTFGLHNTWEGLLVVGGRRLPPGVPDSLQALPARSWGKLPGRKPIAFCAFLFNALGMLPGDELVDLFPGSGMVGRAWRALSPRTSATLSPDQRELVRQRILEPERPATLPSAAQAPARQLSLLEGVSSTAAGGATA